MRLLYKTSINMLFFFAADLLKTRRPQRIGGIVGVLIGSLDNKTPGRAMTTTSVDSSG